MEVIMSRHNPELLYEKIGNDITAMIEGGTYRPGDRLPSIRQISSRFDVSINTAIQAYGVLEDRRIIEARPQSGYYVCARAPEIADTPLQNKNLTSPSEVTISSLCQQIIRHMNDDTLVPLGNAIPHHSHLPVEKLGRIMASEMRRHSRQSISYMMAPGYEKLRKQIAKRSIQAGFSVRPDEVLITSGCVEAVLLALRATCKTGDTIAVESPFYFNFLQLVAQMGLKALEIPSTPREGISLEALGYAIEHNRISACLVIANFGNPLGSLMPDQRKKELVELLAEHEIPLIEDDIYGDLAFGSERPVAAKSFDRKGLVIYCSSFSKTIAPGYRVGWVIGGRFQGEIERLKMMVNLATSSPSQLALAEFLATGGYDHHLRSVRRLYSLNISRMTELVVRHFPEGTRITRPKGGFILWIEMPSEVDALKLYRQALDHGISITPGPLFTLGDKYRSNIRLSTAHLDDKIEEAVITLGRLASGH